MTTNSPPPFESPPAQRGTLHAAESANGISPADSTAEMDDRSSSLSDIGDREANDEVEQPRALPSNASDINDTEAETERLEDSPQKQRKQQNVVLTVSNHVVGDQGDSAVLEPGSIDNADLSWFTSPNFDN